MTTSTAPRLRYVNETVGLLFLVALVMFIAAALGSSRVREWLNPGERLKIILPEDGLFGLSEGADVEILGTKAGKVMQIVIQPGKQMYAEAQIKEGMDAFVRRDSQAVIRKRYGVAGAAYLEITRGVQEPIDWDFAVITATADRAPTDTLAALIEDVQERIIPVIDDTHAAIRAFSSVVNDLQDPQGDLKQMLDHLNDIARSIAKGEGTVGRLLADKEVADHLEAVLVEFTGIVQRITPILNELAATVENITSLSGKFTRQADDLPALSASVQRVLASLDTVLADLGRTTPDLPRIARNVGDATTNLPVLLLQTQQVLTALEQLLTQLQSHWLLGGKRGAAGKGPSGRISPLEVTP